jgi:transcriptional regulator with XRE-family HTH domain
VNYTRNQKYINRLGRNIKSIRKKQGVSQSQIAYESGLSTNQIGRIERGEINTSISQLLAIADALGIPLYELFKFSE